MTTQNAQEPAAALVYSDVLDARCGTLSAESNPNILPIETVEEAIESGAARRDNLLLAAQEEIAAADSTLDAILNIIVRRAQEITRAEGAVVELLDGDDMLYQAASGTARAHLGLRLKAASSLSGRCVREGQPLSCRDAETDARVDREACRRVGVRSMVVVPLTYQRVTQGVLKVYSPHPGAFGDSDISALQMMVGMIVAGMSRVDALEAKRALMMSEERLRLAVDSAQVGTWHWDIATDTLLWSDRCKEIFGLPPDTFIDYARFLELLHPDDREATAQAVRRALETNGVYAAEYRCAWPDGSLHWIAAKGRAFGDGAGCAVRMEGVVLDITEHKRASALMQQQQADLEAMNVRLKRAMTETHHRVKNNLQMISALIEMQSLDNADARLNEELQRLNSYIRAMASVHDVLTLQARQDGEANFVSARAVLNKILPLIRSMARGRELRFHVEDTQISGKHGTSLALIANELTINALKHGSRSLSIRFLVLPHAAILEVCDDGPGFAAGFDPAQSANTGLALIESIGRLDLGGEVCYGRREGGRGGKVTVTIPLANLTTVLAV